LDAHQVPVTDRIHDVVLVGDGDAATELLAAGVHDFVIFDREVVSSVFDDTTDTWTLSTEDGETCRGRVVITCESPFVPRLPDVLGRRDFRGTAMHAAMPSNFFDPAGKRVAVIGADSSAGGLVDRMAAAGARIEVFPLAPRRAVKRRPRLMRRRVKVVTQPIEEVTAVGVRTVDGVHHEADAIVYGTGFAVRAALPQDAVIGARGANLQQNWADGAEPYLGIAMHGFPNYFIAGGPDFTEAIRYIAQSLRLRGRNTRIEVRRSAQGVFNERVHLHRPSWRLDASAFDLSEADDDVYHGPATLSIAEDSQEVEVQLAGHVDPVDGQYHWQGTVFGPIPDAFKKTRSLAVTIGQRSATARITEQTPQGGHSIAGAGEPPFALEDLRFAGTR
jgi:hypothetical protein